MILRFQIFFLIIFGFVSYAQADDKPFIFDNPSPFLECKQPHYTECMLPCAEMLMECLPPDEEIKRKIDEIEADLDAELKLCETRFKTAEEVNKCQEEAVNFHLKRLVNYLNTIGECMKEGFSCSEKCQKKYCEIVIPDFSKME